jgi:CBS domain-containing protein
MTSPAVTIAVDATIDEAVRLMLENRLSGLPVVDSADCIVGVLTEGDLLRRAELGTERKRPRWLEFVLGPAAGARDYVHAHGRRVSEVMTDDPTCIGERTPLSEIVDLMEKRRVKRLPVTRDGRVVGVVSRADVIRALASRKLTTAPTSDKDIHDQILAGFRAQKWGPVSLVGVDVDHGEVTLTGAILDERERDAIRVLVENTPGVTKLHDNLAWVGPEGIYVEAPPERK